MAEVQARETVLLSSEIDLALGKSSRRARSTTTKDLTSIVEAPWIKDAGQQKRLQFRPDSRPEWVSGKRIACGASARQGVQKHIRCRRRDVQVDVVKSRVVRQSIAATNHCLSTTYYSTSESRRPGKTHIRAPAVVRRGNRREGRNRQRQSRIPKRVWSSLILHSPIVEQVGWLPIVGPGDTEIKS